MRLRDLGNTLHRRGARRGDHPQRGLRGGHRARRRRARRIRRGGRARWRTSSPAQSRSPGKFLSGELSVPVPEKRRNGNGKLCTIVGARENNLKNVDVTIPLGRFVAVTGVSGSGKSSLISDILYRRLAQHLYRAKERAGEHDRIEGMELLDKVVDINQSPIGRTPRSNPATYTGVFTPIRELFAALPEAKMRGYLPGRFSFNVKGGRCEACHGEGIIQIEMHFLPDVYVPCEVCKGKRYNREALEIRYKGKNIADVLDMTVEEALEFFQAYPCDQEQAGDPERRWPRLHQAGPACHDALGGRGAAGEAVVRAVEDGQPGRTLYILDEPTTGLHFADVGRLLEVLNRLVDSGNSVVVIEHNLDVIKMADWIIDLGPEGGDAGGWVIATGTPGGCGGQSRFLHRAVPSEDAAAARGSALRGAEQAVCSMSGPASMRRWPVLVSLSCC